MPRPPWDLRLLGSERIATAAWVDPWFLPQAGVLGAQRPGAGGDGASGQGVSGESIRGQTTVFTGETHDYLLPRVLRVLDGLANAGGT